MRRALQAGVAATMGKLSPRPLSRESFSASLFSHLGDGAPVQTKAGSMLGTVSGVMIIRHCTVSRARFSSSVAACCRRIFRRIIELRQEGGDGRIFPLPAYGLADRLLNRHGLLVAEFVADTRGTRRPMLRRIAGLEQVGRRARRR